MAKKASATSAPKVAAGTRLTAATRVAILHGEDRFLQDEYIRLLREALAAALGGPDAFDVVRFDGAQGASIVADIFDECRSFGLMQQHKVILVENADLLLKKQDDDEAAPSKSRRGAPPVDVRRMMESYAAEPSDSATLVLRASGWRPGNLDKAVAALGERGAIIDCEALDPARAAGWATKRASLRHNTSIDPEAARLLIASIGTDLGRIDNELEKLALAAGGNGAPISAALVREMTGVSREEEFWHLQSTLASGDAAASLGRMREMVEVSRHDPVVLTWSFTELARKIHAVRRLADAGQNVQPLVYKLKLFGDATSVFNAARAIPAPHAARLYDIAVDIDAANKSGRGDPIRNLEVLTVKFSSAIRPR